MASGYFPIEKTDPRYARLKTMIDDLRILEQNAWEAAIELGESDNAVSDGSYITYLSLAKELILKVLEK